MRPGTDRAFFCGSVDMGTEKNNRDVKKNKDFQNGVACSFASTDPQLPELWICVYFSIVDDLWTICSAPITIAPDGNDARLQSPTIHHQSSIILLLLLPSSQPSEAIFGAVFGTFRTFGFTISSHQSSSVCFCLCFYFYRWVGQFDPTDSLNHGRPGAAK